MLSVGVTNHDAIQQARKTARDTAVAELDRHQTRSVVVRLALGELLRDPPPQRQYRVSTVTGRMTGWTPRMPRMQNFPLSWRDRPEMYASPSCEIDLEVDDG